MMKEKRLPKGFFSAPEKRDIIRGYKITGEWYLMAKEMTKERQEQLSNRLVMNFGILLGAALIMLYVNSALRSGGMYRSVTYTILLVLGIIGIAGAIAFFVLGKLKKPKLTNYSAIFLGDAIICAMLYIVKFGWIPGYNTVASVVAVYLAMVLYFIILAIVTAIQLRKPVVKTTGETENVSRHAHKAKKKKKRK